MTTDTDRVIRFTGNEENMAYLGHHLVDFTVEDGRVACITITTNGEPLDYAKIRTWKWATLHAAALARAWYW